MLRLCLVLLLTPFISFSQPDVQKKLQTLFINAKDGDIIDLPEGNYQLNQSLWLDGRNNIIITGKGMGKTFLNFAGQISGAEGIKVTNGSKITIKDLTVQDTKGDGIKTQLVEGITFQNVKAEWTKGASSKNGGYGIYPVQCSNVLIENCEARGASDAGIYVGQSKNIIVRNCKAYENVAGIEIENSLYADVYANEATNNTGGILIFDLPDLVQKKGGFIRVYNNNVHHNNHENFAPKGNIVGKVPLGTGIMVMATNNVEIFNNKIIDNITTGTAIVSYYISENPIKDSSYYPYPTQINIHDNTYQRPNVRATMKGRMGKMYRLKLKFGKNVPHIIFDGIADKNNAPKICIRNNNNMSFANIDAANKFKNISRDATAYDCTLPPLLPSPLAKAN
ncbi:MAG: right-handed parallel beta-helix repeat-containing protein [Chitinophagaceae bacterium]|nr:right-handed parallel beta-helix repeat-containing protein [Chitinophagaceae bacterium]